MEIENQNDLNLAAKKELNLEEAEEETSSEDDDS